jgi:hypothetical protein
VRAVIFVVIAAIGGVAGAQPSDADLPAATELYQAAAKAMQDGRYADAARDFTAAYELTKDPVLFFKIASAHDKAGACDVAITYYKRYLDGAKPEAQHVELTNQRIDACKPVAEAPPPAAPTKPAAAPAPPSANTNTAWLLVGGGLAFLTTGVVLAYAAESAEQDIKDLYAGFGPPPRFDDNTRKRYEDMIAEGERYQYLSWASFGIATGCAAAATIFFYRASKETPIVTPVVTPTGAGVRVTF